MDSVPMDFVAKFSVFQVANELEFTSVMVAHSRTNVLRRWLGEMSIHFDFRTGA